MKYLPLILILACAVYANFDYWRTAFRLPKPLRKRFLKEEHKDMGIW